MVRLVRAAGRGADRSRWHRGAAISVARYAAQRIRRRADLAGPGRDGAARRRDDPNRAGPQLNDHDLVRRITFWCLPTCTGGGGSDWRFAKRRAILRLLLRLLLGEIAWIMRTD